jgi:hypothetical protein
LKSHLPFPSTILRFGIKIFNGVNRDCFFFFGSVAVVQGDVRGGVGSIYGRKSAANIVVNTSKRKAI